MYMCPKGVARLLRGVSNNKVKVWVSAMPQNTGKLCIFKVNALIEFLIAILRVSI